MTTPRPSIKLPDESADPRLVRLGSALKGFERRFRLQEAVALAPWALTAAFAATILLAVYERVTVSLVWFDLLLMFTGALMTGLAGMLAYTMLRPRDPFATAVHADVSLGLDERLSTALEDAARPPVRPTPALLALRDAQLDDALHSIAAVDATRALPLHLNTQRFLPAAALAAVLMAVAFFPSLGPANVVADPSPEIAAEQRNIEVLQEAIERSPNADDPELRALLEELAALSEDLKEGDLTREEALARLSETEARLQEALDPQSPAQREALEGLAEQLSGSENPNLQRAADALENNDPQKAAQELNELAENVDNMTPEERRALAQELREARDQLASLDPELASRLEDAAAALESGDNDAAQQAMSNLGEAVEQRAQSAATQRQIEQSLAQIQASKENIAGGNKSTPTGRATALAGSGTPVAGASGTSVAGGTVVASGSSVPGSPVALPSGTRTPVTIVGTAQPGRTATAGTPVVAPGNNGQGQGQGEGEDQVQGQGNGQGQGQGQGSNAGPPSGGWGKGHDEPVYVPPSSVDADLTPVTVQGQENPDGEQSTAPTNTDANSTGPATVPYEQVYGEYEEQAGAALDGDYIPQGYKDLVRDYFSEIAPR